MAWGPLRSRVVAQMRTETSKKAKREHYPAPHALIDLWQKNGGNPQDNGNLHLSEFEVMVGKILPYVVLGYVQLSVILAAAYLLWLYQRVFYGEITNPANAPTASLVAP